MSQYHQQPNFTEVLLRIYTPSFMVFLGVLESSAAGLAAYILQFLFIGLWFLSIVLLFY